MDDAPYSQAYLLLDYAQRLDRHREGRRAVHVHLSRLKPQYRREQHIRVAVNSFEEVVKQYEGQVFVLSSSDLVFVCKDAKIADIDEAVMRLRYLFSEDPLTQGPDEEVMSRFCTWYNMETGYRNFLDTAERLYQEEQTRERRLAAAAAEAGLPREKTDDRRPLTPEQLGKLEDYLQRTDLSSVLRRQHICVVVGENPPQSIIKELYISIADLAESMLPDVNLASNRWLFQHLTQTLDMRMLRMLSRADDSDLFSAFSLNLNISTLMSQEFIAFDSSLRTGSRGTIVLELQPTEVFADYNTYMFARDFAHDKGYRLCLDGVSMSFFDQIDRAKMGIDLIKLVWSPDIANEGNRERRSEIAQQVKDTGKSRIILSRCDSPMAVRIGQSMGITMYQGRFIDQLLQKQRNYTPPPKRPPRRRATFR
jgi:EAL domain-containing protein (putative c-di-GMP-specific phosphodiesterase class I)